MNKFIFSFLFFSFLSCSGEPEEESDVQDIKWTKEESINMNSTFAAEEDVEIDDFLSHRPDWKMKKTGTGLRYFIYSKSEHSDTVRVGDQVTVDFVIELLDGTICYTSEKKGAESFIVEKTDIESGLHEGIKYLSTGDKAKFILPSHMAHGLIGDTEKIPPLSPVIYDITLIKIDNLSNTHP
ncbi:MAG: FKBP-type peptidyl-prolyl cis-trans isomerase [Crocinitomicaceae bacterium]